MRGYILLTFDVEEFDIPLEYGYKIEPDEQLEIGKKGLDVLMPLINAHAISTTMFTTANFALHFPEAVKQMAEHHEIGSHTYYHSRFENADLLKSKQTLEEISGKLVTGLRMPRMQKANIYEIKKAGYVYDCSINPTWIPGRYNNLHKPRVFYNEDGIIRIPASVSPIMRLPLFWLGFKNYPYKLFRRLCFKCLEADGYVCLYFHPWEFVDINQYTLPGYVKNLCGEQLLNRLNNLIQDLRKEFEFSSIQRFLNTHNIKEGIEN